MDDPALFTNFVRNTLGVNTQQIINAITNLVESFWGLLVVNDGDIDTFSNIPILRNNTRVAAQRIFIGNNATQVLKSIFFEIKDR